MSPRVAAWLAAPDNALLALLAPRPALVELGCGVSPLVALALRHRAASYLLTDQPYVHRLLARNLAANPPPPARRGARAPIADVRFRPLDWEADRVAPALAAPHARSFDAVLACDCVFNESLVGPLVQTCADLCALRRADAAPDAAAPDAGPDPDPDPAAAQPCLCIVAQQLRDNAVFRAWLTAFGRRFRVWRVPDAALPAGLRPDDGFVVHVGLLRPAPPP